MRLLRRDSESNISLAQFFGDKIPEYAILSHTWEADDQEVTFQQIRDGSGRRKRGYRKIVFCGEQAAIHGLQFFW